MNRYLHKVQAQIGDRIIFDNKTNFLKDILRIKIIGEIVNVELEGDLVEVSFIVNGSKDPVIKQIPFFLCQ